MKIMFVQGFLLASVWSYSSNSVYAQNQRFTIKFKQTSIQTIFQYIEKHSEFIFMYRTDLLDTSKKVSVKVEGQTVEKILEQVLEGTPVVYEINDRQIILKKGTSVTPEVSQQLGQKKLIQGLVKDERGEAIIGATIKVKDSEIGTTTNMDGLYNLTVPSENSILVVSYIGYITQEIKVGKRQNVMIILKEDAKTLDEVVVTAYGTGQKKASMVGSVQTVRPTDLKVPATNLSTSFAGRLAGVIAVQRSGEPGADGANFWIRGVATLGSNSNPLIIIDGIEASTADLNALDPEVIDGFSILKDATATAMYGMRGANGVMIVTTKSGAALDKPIINFRFEGSMNQPTNIPKFVDGVTFMELYNEAIYNQPAGREAYTQERIEGTRQGLNPYVFPNVDWYNEMFKDRSFSETFNFNIRGGTKKVDYFSSISISHEDGMLKSRSKDFFSFNNNINRMRYSFQNNVNARLGKTSKLSLKLNVMLVDKRSPDKSTSSLFSSVMNNNPVDAPIMFPSDDETPYIKWGVRPNTTTNPLATMVNGYTDTFQSTVIASLNYDQDLSFITKGLKFKAMASLKSFSNSTQTRYANWNAFSMGNWTRNEDGTYGFELTRENTEQTTELKTKSDNNGDRRIYLQAMLEYSRTFGRHDVGGLLIYNQDEYVDSNPGTDLLVALPTRRQGVAARFSYAYDNKYLAEVNLGYNGSENFSKGNRFGFFPSIALGYNISEEPFFKSLNRVVSKMKIRGSYGLVGNGNVGSRFAYLSDIELSGSSSFTTGINMDKSLNGPKYKRFSNNALTWEVGRKSNLGVDFTLFNRFNLTFDVFREERRNIFQTRATIPSYTGVYGTTFYVNSGEVSNQGVDMAIDFGHQFKKDFSMTFKGTFTYAHNEVKKYEESVGDYINLSRVGYSTSQQWGYIADYLFTDQTEIDNNPTQLIGGTIAPGDIKYVNQPNKYGKYDNVIDQNDRVPIGNPTTPEIVYGFGPSIQYKGFDFSFFFQGVAKTSLFMSNLQPFGNTLDVNKNVQTFIAEERWSPDNQNIFAKYPRLTIENSANNSAQSTYWLRDGSFLKLKNAEIGYTYKTMRFYLRGSNLLTFSKFKLWDPEQGGGNGLKYPTQRVFNIGFQMTIK